MNSSDLVADASDVLTVVEAAKLLRVGRNALYDAIGRGELPHMRIGKQIRLSRVALMQALTSRGLTNPTVNT